MRLRATVRHVTGNTSHLMARNLPDAIDVTKIRNPVSLEIVEQEGAFYLLRLNQHGECISDTWHESVGAAKTQAQFEFEVEDRDWTEV